jgi:hypothetical protein
MSTTDDADAKVAAAENCLQAIADAIPTLLEEGGIGDVLRFYAFLIYGRVPSRSVVVKLDRGKGKIRRRRPKRA